MSRRWRRSHSRRRVVRGPRRTASRPRRRRHRGPEPLLGVRVVGQERGRVGQLHLQMRRRRVRRDLPPFAEEAAHQVDVAIAVHRGLRQVGERPAADEGLVCSVGGGEDADQVDVRLARPLGCQGRSAARQRDQREQRVGAHRQQRRLCSGDQSFSRLFLAQLGGRDRMGEVRDQHEADWPVSSARLAASAAW